MCDQTEVSYLENDVVWVKIGPIWWPGVVKDLEKDEEGKEILAGLKKKPIAVVKFFQEDNYEFVKNLDHIYHYNCRRKDEFIKKGLDKFRNGASHMKKFPADVTTAESLVQGDVNIINDPKFYPEKKQNYSEIFGSGKKKSKKEADSHTKTKLQTPRTSTPYRPITHQRFINKVLHGESDHKVRTLIQPLTSPEDSISRGIYKCHMCKFETARVNVIVAHYRLSHSTKNSINWMGSDTRAVRRRPVYKSRKTKAKKLFESSRVESSDEESLDKKKLKAGNEKTKSPIKSKGNNIAIGRGSSLSPRKRKTSGSIDDTQKKPRFTVLLADWSEEDEDDKKTSETGKDKESDEERDEEDNNRDNLSASDTKSGKEDMTDAELKKDETMEDVKNQNEKMSCFDFDEEEDGFIGMSNANTYGRKIPRVIPLKDKSELGVDLEIGELFKKKNEDDAVQEMEVENTLTTSEPRSSEIETDSNEKENETELEEKQEGADEKLKEYDKEEEPEKVVKRKRKLSKDQEVKVDADSLAVRRTRRPGAKKSYLNEVIEKVEDDDNSSQEEKPVEQKVPETENSIEPEKPDVRKPAKEDVPPSSSRRKQDLKQQTMENSLEESVYSEIVNTDQQSKSPADSSEKKLKKKSQSSKTIQNDDLTERIIHLLSQSSVPELPEIPPSIESKTETPPKTSETSTSSNNYNFTFDYISPENSDKSNKSKTEVKSITKMFSDTIKESENKQNSKEPLPPEVISDDINNDGSCSKPEVEPLKVKSPQVVETVDAEDTKVASTQSTAGTKKFSSVLNSVVAHESADEQSEAPQIVKDGNSSITSGCKKIDIKNVLGDGKEGQESTTETSESSARPKSVKTIKLKTDSLQSTLLSPAGKLKGQTIIHQKGGTYVILSQPPQLPRQKVTTAKGQTSGKLVILTSQLGEQKIITTSGLQQSKFSPQKVMVSTSGGNNVTDSTASTSGVLSVGKAQPVIKMVPDGKGGVMKQLTVSPKKVLVGGTKVLVPGGGATFSSPGSTIQKIALTSGNNLSGDYRVIENYKGSGKTVLIQGGSNASTGVLLKTGSGVQRHTTGDATQGSQNILNIRKKPKILMRATSNQNEYVVHSEIATVESPTYLMKTKGPDGKFSTQKIIRRPVISPPKAKASSTGSKTFFLSSEQPVQKGESLIIKTNHEPAANKVIRLTQKVKEPDIKQKYSQKIIQKAPENFAVSQNTIFTAAESEEQEVKNESAQIVQVTQNPTQQPILQTQVMAMPGPIGSDGNQTFVLVSVDEHGVVQPVDNSLITYNASGQTDPVFMNSNPNNNVILINPQANEEIKPVFSNGTQDILAEALANTNVLEGSMTNEMESVMPSILLPPSIPSSVVQETSITLQKPIMTPLEMPTSVAPDTSGLEPPPLPPTPTDEDVLMEDQDVELQTAEDIRDAELMNLENIKEQEVDKASDCLMELKNTDSTEQPFKENGEDQMELTGENCEMNFPEAKKIDEGNGALGFYDQTCKNGEQKYDHDDPREEFIIENSQEEQGSTSFQSMPLLNDEPDTSDDAQGSEPIADQDFDVQKSRVENEELSQLMREQEPPSSTNNEVMTETGFENPKAVVVSTCDTYRPVFQETLAEEDDRVHESEKVQEDSKMKEVVENKDMQSMPVITDDGSVNSYAIGQMYVGALSQKRFQEETEVTSTTDEFSNKDNNIV